jgi:uncharacterized protein YdhG (YjbR/CyaY superfamily)
VQAATYSQKRLAWPFLNLLPPLLFTAIRPDIIKSAIPDIGFAMNDLCCKTENLRKRGIRFMNEVELYMQGFPEEVRERLTAIRNSILELAPQATERICMRMPTYDLNGKWLVHFAGYEKHIGFYPQPEGVAAFKEKLTGYKTSKGTVQFPLSKPLPIDLIREIIRFRVEEQSK